MNDNWMVCDGTFARVVNLNQGLYGGYLSEDEIGEWHNGADGANRRQEIDGAEV